MMYGLPANYQPGKKPDPIEPIPDSIKQRAKLQGAEYIHKSGSYSVKWWYDRMLKSHAPDFEAWEEVTGPELPAGELIEL